MIVLHTGPMFAGKTTALVRKWGECVCYGMRVLAVKPLKDTRGADRDCLTSHDGAWAKAEQVGTIKELASRSVLPPVVLIDEGQFFDDLVPGCLALAALGVEVHVAALNGTAAQEQWPRVSELIPHVDLVRTYTARCNDCDGTDAKYTVLRQTAMENQRQQNGGVLIGGSEIYAAVCAKCLAKRRQ